MWEQEPGSPMMGRQLGQSGRALSPHRNHLREEMLLSIRAWGGQLRGMWAKIQDAKSLCPAKADISPSRPQRAGVEQPSLHSAEWTVPQRAGRGRLRLGTCPPHPRMGCGTNFTEPTATTKPRAVPTGGISYSPAPLAHARSLGCSLAQETAARAAAGQGAADEACASKSICHLLRV